jgi:hypothetical protein
LGGTSYAAATITGRQVKDSSLTGRDVRNGSRTGSDLKPKSVPLNRLSGALPAGAAGAAGQTGPAGPPGEPDYSRVYHKAAADARFLAKAGKAAHADRLDGLDGSAYAKGSVVTRSASKTVATSSTAELLKVPGWGSVAVLNCNASFANVGLTAGSAVSTAPQRSRSPRSPSRARGAYPPDSPVQARDPLSEPVAAWKRSGPRWSRCSSRPRPTSWPSTRFPPASAKEAGRVR